MAIVKAMEQATTHHQAGRLHEAEVIYRQILSERPDQSDALQLLGVLALQSGNHPAAIELIRRALAIKPDSPHYLCNLGQALSASGQFDAAITAYNRALELQPDLPEAYNSIGNALFATHRLPQAVDAFRRAIGMRPEFVEAYSNLGNLLASMNEHDQAIVVFQQALALRPDFAEGLCNLGNSLQAKGQFSEAMAVLRRSLALRPNMPETHNNLGNLLQATGRHAEAADAYRQAIALKPGFANAHNNLGSALQSLGQNDQAIAEYRNALATRPDYPEVYNNIGSALRSVGRFDEAVSAFRHALSLRPDLYEAMVNLGASLYAAGKIDEAIDAFRRSIQLKPDRPMPHVNLGMTLLLRGEFKQGWSEYEWRWKAGELKYPFENSDKPQWDGNPLEGQRILIESEQGFGDTIQFARYLPFVAQRGAKVILACRKELAELLRGSLPDVDVIPRGETLPSFDVHTPLLSLPRIFDTNLENIPAKIPYLRTDESKSRQWRERLAALNSDLKVGLTWAGRPDNKADQNRSLPLSAFAPLAMPNVFFISLQKASRPASTAELEPKLTDWTEDLNDFSDTAALVENLDLIITIDSAVAHLAGALGKPVWLLLPLVPDWRWLLNRNDSPWYPSMRLFRQLRLRDWEPPIKQVAEALKTLASR